MIGKSVLDIGTASGFLSFEAEAAGASEVVSFDMDTAERQILQPFNDSLYFTNHAAWVGEQTAVIRRWKMGYWTAHHALASKARAVYGNIYRLPRPSASLMSSSSAPCLSTFQTRLRLWPQSRVTPLTA
jgi:hypothetical protein